MGPTLVAGGSTARDLKVALGFFDLINVRRYRFHKDSQWRRLEHLGGVLVRLAELGRLLQWGGMWPAKSAYVVVLSGALPMQLEQVRHPNQVRQRDRVHFFHHTTAMHFDGFFGDTKLTGNLLIEQPRSHRREYFTLTRGKQP